MNNTAPWKVLDPQSRSSRVQVYTWDDTPSGHDLALFTVCGPGGLGILVDHERLRSRVGPLIEQVHDPAFAAELGVPARSPVG